MKIARKSRIVGVKLVVFIILSLAAFASQAQVKPEKVAKQRWYQASTPNFTVISDRGKTETRRLTRNLEKFRALYALFFKVDLSSVRPVKLMVTQKDSTYEMLYAYGEGVRNTGGFFITQVSGNYSALRSFPGFKDGSLSILFHEYAHYLQFNTETVSYPYWYTEGLATYLSSTRFFKGGGIHYGVPIDSLWQSLKRTAWMPMEKLFKASSISATDRRDFSRVYSQGWLAVHYFSSNSERNRRLSDYLRLVYEGASVDQAMQQGLKVTFDEFDKELQRYRNQRKLGYLDISKGLSLDISEPVIERMPAEKVAYEIGEFLLNAHGNYDLSRPFFKHALELKPDYSDAMAGLANTFLSETGRQQMKQYVEKALEIDHNNPWVRTVAGHYYDYEYDNAENEHTKNRFWKAAISHYNQAISRNAHNTEAMYSAAKLYMLNDHWSEALTLNEKVLALAPANYSVKLTLIENYYAMNQAERAEALITTLRHTPHLSEERAKNLEDYVIKIRERYAGR